MSILLAQLGPCQVSCPLRYLEHAVRHEQGLQPSDPCVHLFTDLTSSEIFTVRTWLAMVRTRPLEMSFSTVSWGRKTVSGFRLDTGHTLYR